MKKDYHKRSTRKSSYISIYVRNRNLTPSSYYRVIQYSKHFDGDVIIREIAPTLIYQKQINVNKNNLLCKYLIGLIYYITMLSRCIFFLTCDCYKKPKIIIVSKTFCPRYTPLIIREMIIRVVKNSTLYWDFDDYIFAKGEISKAQTKILEKHSKRIIVTSEYLKSKIDIRYQDKVFLLPTTDGDLQGFNERVLLAHRLESFKDEVRLVWVATSNNIPHLKKIVIALDEAAKIIKLNECKNLILTVVCNKPLDYDVNNLVIRNIIWTREIAKKEIYDSHIGIMPLIMNEYSLGKGAFKLVQYISTGLPVIASKVGFNQEVVNEKCGVLVDDELNVDEWINAILKLIRSEEVWVKFSDSAYKRWEAAFSFEHNLKFWKDLLVNE